MMSHDGTVNGDRSGIASRDSGRGCESTGKPFVHDPELELAAQQCKLQAPSGVLAHASTCQDNPNLVYRAVKEKKYEMRLF